MDFLRPFRQRPLRSSLLLLQIFLGSLVMTLALSAAFGSRTQDAPPERFNLLAGYETEGTSNSFGVFLGRDLPELRELAPDVEQLAIISDLYNPTVVVGDTRYALRSGARATSSSSPPNSSEALRLPTPRSKRVRMSHCFQKARLRRCSATPIRSGKR